jgi:hypothetical protein
MSHTVLPANIDDDQLVGHGPIQALPLTQYTVRSWFLSNHGV